MPEPLTKNDKQENRQRKTLIVLKIFYKFEKQKWSPEPTQKNGATPKSHTSRSIF
jgi:hypothetical protein